MGFRNAKSRILTALERGDYSHEPREVQAEKNLLAVGDVTPEFVAGLVRKTSGRDYQSSPHHADASVEVHIFRASTNDKARWYVKAYFAPDDATVFISVHPG